MVEEKTVKVKTTCGKLLEIVNAVLGLTNEAKMIFGKDGITIIEVDPVHVGMVNISVGKDAFEEYNAVGTVELGLDFYKVQGLLKIDSADTKVDMEYNCSTNKVKFQIGDLITRNISGMDISTSTEIKILKLTLKSMCELRSEQLSMGVRAVKEVSDAITVSIDKDGIRFMGENETDDVTTKYVKSEVSTLTALEKAGVSKYSMEYIEVLIKGIGGKNKPISLKMDTDMPIEIAFQICDGKGTVKYIIAPRVGEK